MRYKLSEIPVALFNDFDYYLSMIIDAESIKPTKPTINLRGPEGNVFVLMGLAQRWARQKRLNSDEIIKDMMSDDYEHALSVIEKHFGEDVILIR